jgi:pyruvate kinase
VDVAPQLRLPDLRAHAEVESQRKMALYRNVQPLFLEQSSDRDAVLRRAEDAARLEGQVRAATSIVLTIGEPMGSREGPTP